MASQREETPMKKATVLLPEPLWHKLRIRVLEERTSLQKVMLEQLINYLKSPKKEPTR